MARPKIDTGALKGATTTQTIGGDDFEQMQAAQDAAAARAGESTKKSFAQNLLGTSGALLKEGDPLSGEEKYQAGLRTQRAARIRSIVANFRAKMRGEQA